MEEIQYIVTKKKTGHYTIDVYKPSTLLGSELITTVGVAKGSPVAQCLRLFERLFNLSDRLAGYNQ